MVPLPIRLGVHVSIAGGIEKAPSRARALGCTAMQIFSRNPRGWAASPLDRQRVLRFRRAVAEAGVDPAVIHTPYLLNLAAEDDALFRQSVTALALDLTRAEELGIPYVVTHLGSSGSRGVSFALERVVRALDHALEMDSAAFLLLENSAGSGNLLGSSLEELHRILEGLRRKERAGICFDTCHAFAAGYDFRTPEQAGVLGKRIEETIGKTRLRLLHLNDSSGPLGSRLDRHQHIGRGEIRLEGFQSLLGHPAFGTLPMILETPRKTPGDDAENLARIRSVLEALQGESRSPRGRKAGRNSAAR